MRTSSLTRQPHPPPLALTLSSYRHNDMAFLRPPPSHPPQTHSSHRSQWVTQAPPPSLPPHLHHSHPHPLTPPQRPRQTHRTPRPPANNRTVPKWVGRLGNRPASLLICRGSRTQTRRVWEGEERGRGRRAWHHSCLSLGYTCWQCWGSSSPT